MRHFKLTLAALAFATIFVAPCFASPDLMVVDNVQFNFSNVTLADSTSVTGYIDINPIYGIVTGSDFTAEGIVFTGNGTITTPDNFVEVSFQSGGDQFVIYFPDSSLQNYTGGPICSVDDNACGGQFSAFLLPVDPDVISGSLQPASTTVTPEPSSFVLLGSGILGAAGAARRRFFKR